MSGRRATAYARMLVRRGVVAGWRRRAPLGWGNFPSEVGRPLIAGPDRLVADIGRSELVTAVRRGIGDPTRIHLLHAGSIMRASDIAPRGTGFFLDGVGALVDHVLATAPTPAVGMRRLLGNDLLNEDRVLVSLDERAMRVGKALMSATAQVLALDRDPALLFEPRMIDATADFVRNYVVRGVYEHASLSELRLMVRLETELASWLGVRYQLRLPDLLGTSLKQGPDVILYHGDRAYRVELKAYRTLESLFSGGISVRYRHFDIIGTTQRAKVVTMVTGPSGPQQAFTGARRAWLWGNKVPGLGMPLPANGAVLPTAAELRTWTLLSPVAAFVVDDEHLVNTALDLVSEAAYRTGLNRVDLLGHTIAPEEIREFLVDMFGGRFVGVTGPRQWEDLHDNARSWLVEQLARLETDINRFLIDPATRVDLGRINQVKLLLATDGVARIPQALGIPQP